MAIPAHHFLCALVLALAGMAAHAVTESLDPRIEAATRLYREQGAAKSLRLFENLANEYAQGAQVRNHAAALHYVGECRWRLGQFPEARRNLERSLALSRSGGDRLAEGKTLNVLGLLAWDEGNYDRAIASFRQAGAIAREAGDRKLEGSSLNNLSLVYDEQGDYDTSLTQYRQVLELYRGANFPRGVGDTLGNIGGVHLLLGHFREALGYYTQALAISEELKSVTALSQDHGNIALCLIGLGEVDEAIGHLDRAIGYAVAAGMRQDEAYWLRVRAGARVRQGRYDLALPDFRLALATYDQVGAQAELVETLHDSAQLHLLLGDSASAEGDFKRALAISRKIGLDRGVTQNLIALGDVERRRQRIGPALALYEQARQRAAASGVQHAEAESLLRLSRVHSEQSNYALASAETGQALAIARQVGAKSIEAEALLAQADQARLERKFDAALRQYTSAERANERIGDPDLLWQIHFGRARVQAAGGNLPAAIGSLELAVGIIEGVRGRLQEPRYRSGYVEDKFDVYLELMRLQLELGRTADAFSTAERLRTRTFVEQLGGRATSPLTPQERRTEAEYRERVRRLQESLLDTGDDGSPAYPGRAISRFSQELLRAEKDYQSFLDDHARVRTTAGSTPSAIAVQRRLQPGQALVEYVVGNETLVVFVLTPRAVQVKSLTVSGADLVARVDLLRDLVRQPADDRWRKPAARLAEQLFAPLERAGWLEGVDRLYIVPHGALTYLPFALLPRTSDAPGGLLVDRYTVAYLPAAAALLRTEGETHAAGSLLAVAPSTGGLRHASEEALVIGKLFGTDARTLIGRQATETLFKRMAGDFRVLHLATHGYFNEASPLFSGLQLEPQGDDDGMLRVHEILDLPLHANLVTLSACDTALGTGYFAELPIGEEFVGLNRAFLAAGSSSVLATLWQVDDRASVELMRRFYGRLRASAVGEVPAVALASAQRELRRSSQLQHPYYWAAYVVVGQAHSQLEGARPSPERTS